MIVTGDLLDESGFPTVELADLAGIRELRKKDRVRVLINDYTPGLASRGAEDGPVYGFEIDMARSLARAIYGNTQDVDSHIEFVEAANAEKIDMLVDNHVDLIIANLTDTVERRQKIDFAGHYVSMRFAPYLGPNSPDVNTVDDLAGLTIGAEAGSMDEAVLRSVAKDSEIVPMSSTQEWIDTYDSGRVQAYWGDTLVGSSYLRTPGSFVRQGQFKAGVGHSAVGVSKNHSDLSRMVNAYMAHMLSTGSLTRSLRKWGL
jgi:ABC-type amino acid transport substrate-binding protein